MPCGRSLFFLYSLSRQYSQCEVLAQIVSVFSSIVENRSIEIPEGLRGLSNRPPRFDKRSFFVSLASWWFKKKRRTPQVKYAALSLPCPVICSCRACIATFAQLPKIDLLQKDITVFRGFDKILYGADLGAVQGVAFFYRSDDPRPLYFQVF